MTSQKNAVKNIDVFQIFLIEDVKLKLVTVLKVLSRYLPTFLIKKIWQVEKIENLSPNRVRVK